MLDVVAVSTRSLLGSRLWNMKPPNQLCDFIQGFAKQT